MIRLPADRIPQRGLALVAVLWMVAALTLLVASLLTMSRATTRSAQNHAALVQATAAGDAAIQLALAESRHLPDNLGGSSGQYVFDGRSVRVELTPASGYININFAPPELLAELFHVAGGLDAGSAEILARRVVDWRDTDEEAYGGGSELEPYLAAGLAVRPRNGAFLSKEDLLQVAGIGLDLFARIEPLITVWGSHRGVDPLAAPEGVLAVLAEGDPGLAQSIARQRANDGAMFDTSTLNPAYLGTGSAGVFHVQATVVMDDGASIVRSRWVEVRAGEDGTPWRSAATEPARYAPALSN
ncbi:general secretion pathway protein GspK [Thauera butanivorans]|uniref:general secretion pathway protein GspK n=1 Tax=Thauera butanivorans TaxID=86174 RepID=UPI003AB56BA3